MKVKFTRNKLPRSRYSLPDDGQKLSDLKSTFTFYCILYFVCNWFSSIYEGDKELITNSHDDSIVQHADNLFSSHLPPINDENDVDELHATRSDHNEGIWENIVTLLE